MHAGEMKVVPFSLASGHVSWSRLVPVVRRLDQCVVPRQAKRGSRGRGNDGRGADPPRVDPRHQAAGGRPLRDHARPVHFGAAASEVVELRLKSEPGGRVY